MRLFLFLLVVSAAPTAQAAGADFNTQKPRVLNDQSPPTSLPSYQPSAKPTTSEPTASPTSKFVLLAEKSSFDASLENCTMEDSKLCTSFDDNDCVSHESCDSVCTGVNGCIGYNYNFAGNAQTKGCYVFVGIGCFVKLKSNNNAYAYAISTTSPSMSPSASPSKAPTSSVPTTTPTASPTSQSPSAIPSWSPSVDPTTNPSSAPTAAPSTVPTVSPSAQPSVAPTNTPTTAPTETKTSVPTEAPTDAQETDAPSLSSTSKPTMAPTDAPTDEPTVESTTTPTNRQETDVPSLPSTNAPTSTPTEAKTDRPTTVPTYVQTTDVPSSTYTNMPTMAPTKRATSGPTTAPSNAKTERPTATSPSLDRSSASPTATADGETVTVRGTLTLTDQFVADYSEGSPKFVALVAAMAQVFEVPDASVRCTVDQAKADGTRRRLDEVRGIVVNFVVTSADLTNTETLLSSTDEDGARYDNLVDALSLALADQEVFAEEYGSEDDVRAALYFNEVTIDDDATLPTETTNDKEDADPTWLLPVIVAGSVCGAAMLIGAFFFAKKRRSAGQAGVRSKRGRDRGGLRETFRSDRKMMKPSSDSLELGNVYPGALPLNDKAPQRFRSSSSSDFI